MRLVELMSDGSEEILLCSDDGAEQGLRGDAAADMQEGSHICVVPLPPLAAAPRLLLEYKPFAQPLSAPADRVQPPLIILNPDPSLKRLQRHLVHLRAGPSVAEVLPKRDASAALASLDDSMDIESPSKRARLPPCGLQSASVPLRPQRIAKRKAADMEHVENLMSTFYLGGGSKQARRGPFAPNVMT